MQHLCSFTCKDYCVQELMFSIKALTLSLPIILPLRQHRERLGVTMINHLETIINHGPRAGEASDFEKEQKTETSLLAYIEHPIRTISWPSLSDFSVLLPTILEILGLL